MDEEKILNFKGKIVEDIKIEKMNAGYKGIEIIVDGVKLKLLVNGFWVE